MGSLFVQLGQCGSQIGVKLNPLLSNSYYCTRNRLPNRLHAIMIDTQPKVLKPIIQKNPKWLDPQNINYFQHGRGNNWSYGYMHDLPMNKQHGNILQDHKQFSHLNNTQTVQKYFLQNKKIATYCLQRLRRQLQTVDCPMAINLICSLGGGTGSGLGTKLIQLINQQFNIDIFAHLVLPNMSGQTPLQIYNCSLSLGIIQEYASGVFIMQNEKYVQFFRQNQQKQNKQNTKFQSGSLDEINDLIAKNICRMVKINDLPGYNQFYNGIINELVISPQLKYLTLFGSQSYQKNWDLPFQSLYQQIKIYNKSFRNFNLQEFNEKETLQRQKLLSSHFMLIGKQQCEYEQKYAKKLNNMLNPIEQIQNLKPVKINYRGTHISSLLDKKQTKNKQNLVKNQINLIANHSNIVRYLSYIVDSARIKYQNKAYLWHYQYANLSQSFQKLQYVIDQYKFFAHKKY